MSPVAASGPTAARLELAEQVRVLHDFGFGFKQIAVDLGISRAYAAELYDDPEGAKARARKASYRGSCIDCGAPTTGSNGRDRAPARCDPCTRRLASEERRWTEEAVVDAIRRFAAIHGRPPSSEEWIKADPENGYPPRSAVYGNGGKGKGHWMQPFRKWGDAIEAAGFPRPAVGQYVVARRNVRRPRRQIISPEGERKAVRDYIVLELGKDGRWIDHGRVQAYSESLAIETLVEKQAGANGQGSRRFVAVSAARWVIRELQPVTTFKAVAVEPA